MATTYDRRRPRIPEDLGQRIDATRGQVPFDAFVRRAVEAALGNRETDSSRVAPGSAVGHGPSAPPQASGPSEERVIEAKAKLSGAEDGGTGPSFRTRDLSGHDFPGGHDGYKAWRSRRDRWRSR